MGANEITLVSMMGSGTGPKVLWRSYLRKENEKTKAREKSQVKRHK